MTTIYVDADACPVKDEVYRVAERHGVAVVVVANSYIRLPPGVPNLRLEVVAEGLDKADDWIAETATTGDVVVTSDVPLAARSVKTGARVLAPTGREFSEASIGMDLASRNLMSDLRAANPTESFGAHGLGGPKPFSQKDRSAFLQALHLMLEKLKRA